MAGEKSGSLPLWSNCRRRTLAWMVAVCFALGPVQAIQAAQAAQTAEEDAPNWRENRILQPEKVTVGPDDNYQAQLDASGERLIFTRHRHLRSEVVAQALRSGVTRDLLPYGYDAKDPALSPNAQRLAVTAYPPNAFGSVCWTPLELSGEQRRRAPQVEIDCITEPGLRAWLPFWIDNDRIGYLRDDPQQRQSELVIYSIEDDTHRVLLRGVLAAPAASPDGRYLAYHRQQVRGGAAPGLYLYDLRSEREHGPVPLDLPGVSSFSAIDTDAEYLYFGHYLSDTNGDQRIDGEDHSVLFRLPLQAALEASDRPLIPEQLTSVEHDCNFPALDRDWLYATCAYEGSLDTYRLPLTGQVPPHWQAEALWAAHATASSYETRAFLINVLRHRALSAAAPATGPQVSGLLTRLLANHLAVDEFTAAAFYAGELERSATASGAGEQADLFLNLQRLIELRSAAQNQPPGLVTADFRRQLAQARARLESMPPSASPALFAAWIDALELRPQRAKERLGEAVLHSLPLGRYLHFELERRLYAAEPDELFERLVAASRDPVIASDARLYYAHQALHLLARRSDRLPRTVATLEALQSASEDARVADLFANEADLLRLAAATEQSDERAAYSAIAARLRTYADDLSWRRVVYVRGIGQLGRAEKYDFMELLARHWLISTDVRHVAFAATAEQYAVINLSRAYGALSLEEDAAALNTFYAVLRQTNDLEALYNLLRIGLADEQRLERMERLYEQLRAEGLLGDHHRYGEVVRLLLTTTVSPDELEAASASLAAMELSGLDRGVSDLLRGALYHRRLLADQDGYRYDTQLYQQAHRHYMLALDLAYANPRVEASLLENLGQLHFQVRNYGLAAAFFGQRLRLPALSAEDEVWLRWRYARALFYSNRMAAAAEQSEQALALGRQAGFAADRLTPLSERTAFYALQAGRYARAAVLYTELLEGEQLAGTNHAKARFNAAYAHFRQGETQAARDGFTALLERLPALAVRPAGDGRLADFRPRRLQVQSYGFLAQLAADEGARADWLARRIGLLEKMESKELRYGFDEPGRWALIIQTRLQYAVSLEALGEHGRMVAAMDRALEDLEAYQAAGGSYNSVPVVQALSDYLTLGGLYPQHFAAPSKRLQRLLTATQDDLDVDGYTPPVNDFRQLKLRLLETFYRAGQREEEGGQWLHEQTTALRGSSQWQALAERYVDGYDELEALLAGVRARSD